MNAPQTATIAQLRAPAPSPETQLPAVRAGFFDLQSFELMQRIAKGFAASTLVPQVYQGNLANCMIALNLAQRINGDPLMVMQNLVIVHGRPTWSAQYLIATANMCGRFSAIRFEFFGERNSDSWGCRAWAIEKATGEKLVGSDITVAIAKKEGWYGKNGSKWQSIPQQMLMYRAGSWWVRAYAPELSMGLMTADEAHDVFDATAGADGTYQVDLSSLRVVEPDAPTGGAAPSQSENADGSPAGVEKPEGSGETGQGGSGETGAEGTAPSGSTAQPSSQNQGGPTFEDAIAAVERGELDIASDVARSLTEGQRKQIEAAIANKKSANQHSGGKRTAASRNQREFDAE